MFSHHTTSLPFQEHIASISRAHIDMVRKDYEEKWQQRLKELKAYKEKYGDCLVSRYDKHNAKLGRWVDHQRSEYKKWLNGVNAYITQERIDQLNEIDFVWEVGRTSKPNDTVWKHHFNELVKYKKKHGDCLVPNKYKQNAKLGEWVSRQRQEYKKWLKGVHSSITQERIDQLNEIDFVWEVGKHFQRDDTVWKQHFNELVKYKKKHGDCLVPYNYKHNAALGAWISTQRLQYKKWLNGVNAYITQERIDQLNEIDFVWEGGKSHPNDALWKQRFNELVKYKKKHGDCLVPYNYKQNAKLGRWVSYQRQQYKKWLNGVYSTITQGRIDQLDEIDFVWDARFAQKSKESNRSNHESVIPSVEHRNIASVRNKSNQPRKRQISSKDRPKKRQRRRQSQDVDRELSPSERKARRRFALQALYNCRNKMQPDEVVSV